MGDLAYSQNVKQTPHMVRVNNSRKLSEQRSISCGSKSIVNKILKPLTTMNNVKLGKIPVGEAASFLLKVAVLEAIRRLSKDKCPVVWSGLQALQIFCYPPLKWIQKWNPFGILVEGLQMLSRPLLVISVATALSDHSDDFNGGTQNLGGTVDTDSTAESHPDSTPNMRAGEGSATSSSNWLVQLYKELKVQGITLPERIDEEEIHRFYAASNGDFSRLLSSIRKTVYWRDTYRILSKEELEIWSNMVFWHGFDINDRPCLVIRLGFACGSLQSNDKPRFAQAVVSQVEYGVVNLVDAENPQITVLVDCEGLSPLKVPMQMLKSCSTLLQDHFPDRLGCLFVIRLPPVARVILQTSLQVLKPITRKKLKVEGNMFQKAISECFLTLPAYLGGDCNCHSCAALNNCSAQRSLLIASNRTESDAVYGVEGNQLPYRSFYDGTSMNFEFDQILRFSILSILIFAVVIALISGIYDPESRPALFPLNG